MRWKHTNHWRDLLCGKYRHDLTKISGFNGCLPRNCDWIESRDRCHVRHMHQARGHRSFMLFATEVMLITAGCCTFCDVTCDTCLFFRTAEALLAPRVLVGISHDDYESLASSVIFSLCDSGVTRAAPSVDTRLHRSSSSDNPGASSGQCSGVRTVSGKDHGDFEAGGETEDPKRSGLTEVRTSVVTPDMSLILPDKSLSDDGETKTPSGQTTSSEDSWVMPSMWHKHGN